MKLFNNSLNRLVNTLSNIKPNICIKDIKWHEKTQNYYKNLASKLNNSPSKQHKIIKKVHTVLPEIKSPFNFPRTKHSKASKCILLDTLNSKDRVIERTSMTELEKQIEKNIEEYLEQKPTSKMSKTKANLTEMSTKSNSSLGNYMHHKIMVNPQKRKNRSPSSDECHKKTSTDSISKLKSIAEESNLANKSKRYSKPTKRKSGFKTKLNVI